MKHKMIYSLDSLQWIIIKTLNSIESEHELNVHEITNFG